MGSQSRKMSIGIVVDSLTKPMCAPTEGDRVLLQSGGKETPIGQSHAGRNFEKPEVQFSGKGSRCEAERQEGSPWITPRSVKRRTPVREIPDITKITSNAAGLATYERTTRSSVHFGGNQSMLKSDDGKQRTVDGVSYRKENENDASVVNDNKVPDATAQKVCLAEKGVLQDRINLPENQSKEMLIMNLWNTLGTSSTPNKQLLKKPEAGADDSKREQNMLDKPSKTKQSSDTIEPDSESPVQVITRAVKRSSTRKRASLKMQRQSTTKKKATPGVVDSKKVRQNQLTGVKVRQQKKAISFDVRRFTIDPNAATASSVSKRYADKKSGGVKSTDIIPPAKDVGDQLSEHISRRPPSPESKKDASVMGKQSTESTRMSKLKDKQEDLEGPTSHRKTEGQNQFCSESPLKNDLQSPDARSPVLGMEPASHSPFPGSVPQVNGTEEQGRARLKSGCIVTDTLTLGSKLFGSPTKSVTGKQYQNSCSSKMKCQPGDVVDPCSADNVEKQSHSHGRNQQKIAEASYEFLSPELQMKTAAPIPSPSPFPDQVNEMERPYNVPTHVEAYFFDSKFKNGLTTSLNNSGSDTSESSDDTAETKDSSTSTPVNSTGEKNKDGGRFTFKRPKLELDSIEDDAFANKGFKEELDSFLGIHVMEKPPLRRNKRFRIHQDNNHSEFSPMFGSPKETNDMIDVSLQTEEDGLSSAVSLFGSALEKVKNKMMSAMKKRCSEILASSEEEIHQQLQIVESRIQNDIAKLTTQSKSKRKCLETRFEELQEQLKVIHEKFREEINQHLQDCRNSVEELEAEETELGGAIERQKASHRKLLLQVEEAVQNNLVDVQRRITLVHQSGREKMLQLKLALAECLKDGIFT